MPNPFLVLLVGAVLILLWRHRALRVRLLERGDRTLGRVHAQLGPMTPEEFIQCSIRALKRAATETHSQLVLPNVIHIGISPADFDPWGPLVAQLRTELLDAMHQLADELDYAILGRPVIHLSRDPSAKSHRPRFRMTLESATEAHQPIRGIDTAPTPLVRRPRQARDHDRPTEYSPSDGGTVPHGIDARPTGRLVVLLVEFNSQPALEVHCDEGSHLGGRGEDCEIRIDHPTVSEVHFELLVSRTGVTIRDEGSTNGTRLRGGRLALDPIALHDGDVVLLSGAVSIQVVRGAEARRAA